jgi:outer membrane protein assembly factor BamB
LSLLGKNASPEAVTHLARKIEREGPQLWVSVGDRGVTLTAQGVPIDYTLQKISRYLRIKIEGSEGLRPPRLGDARWETRDTFLRSLAEQVGGTLSKDGETYRIAARVQPAQPPLPSPWEPIWKVTAKWPFLHTPVVADGRAVIVLEYDVLSALDVKTGRVLWSTKLDDLAGAPVVVDGVVYVGGSDNGMYALRLNDGAVLWRHRGEIREEGGARAMHQVTALGRFADLALFISQDENVYAVNAASGKRAWVYPLGTNGPVSVLLAGGRMYVASKDEVRAVDPANRDILWRATVPISKGTVLAAHEGRLYVCGDKTVTAIAMNDGAHIWQYTTGRESHPCAPPLLTGGTLVFAAGWNDVNVYGINPRTGELVWRTPFPAFAMGLTPFRKDRVFVSLHNCDLALLNVSSGEVLEQRSLKLSGHGSPVIVDDTVLVPERDGEVKAKDEYGVGILTAFRLPPALLKR